MRLALPLRASFWGVFLFKKKILILRLGKEYKINDRKQTGKIVMTGDRENDRDNRKIVGLGWLGSIFI